jgi:hypothetical protein
MATSFVGCSYAPFYTGDGQFTDNGLMAYSRRFIIDLGPIDLSKTGIYNYTLSGLPNAEFVISVRVVEKSNNTLNTKPDYSALVRVQLEDSQNKTIICEEAPLNSWIRSYGTLNNISELYRRGEGQDVFVPDGNTKGERVASKASGGWGTYFYSDQGEKYKLKVSVLASSINRPASIILVGWSR